MGQNCLLVTKATMNDVNPIHQLISQYARQSLLLPRKKTYLYEHLRQYYVAKLNGQVIGVGALRIFGFDIAEICSLAVVAEYRNQKIGSLILERLEEEAKALQLSKVFALTYQVEFFLKSGYHIVNKKQLSQKIWADCIHCPKYTDCDETAVIKEF